MHKICTRATAQSKLKATVHQMEQRILCYNRHSCKAPHLSEEDVVVWIELSFVSQHESPLSFLSFHFISHCWSHCAIRYAIVTVSLDKNMFSKKAAADDESPENKAIVF